MNKDPLKTKQLEKGLQQLTDEGVAQLFTQYQGAVKIIGTVGELQFEVIQFRLLHEYGASCAFQHLNYYKACWVTSEDTVELNRFLQVRSKNVAFDKEANPVFF